MRVKIIMDCQAEVRLSPREVALVRGHRVPAIYSPGGMSLVEMPDDQGRAKFGGAVFVNAEACLNSALDAFRDALNAA